MRFPSAADVTAWFGKFETVIDRIRLASPRYLASLDTPESKLFGATNTAGRGIGYNQAQVDPRVRSTGISRLMRLGLGDVPWHEDQWVLDLLGGDGVVARCLNHLAAPQMRPSVLTSDHSLYMVSAAVAYGLDAALQSATYLITADRSFDMVLSAYGTHHISPQHRQTLCDEAARVLKPNGRFVLHDFEPSSPVAQWFAVVDKYGSHGHAFNHFKPSELRQYLRAAGFVDIRIEYVYDPFVLRASPAGDPRRFLAEHLKAMYSLQLPSHAGEDELDCVFRLADECFRYTDDELSHCNGDAGFVGKIEIRHGANGYEIEMPRIAVVATGTRPRD